MSKFSTALDGYFEITKRKSKISTEIIAGLTTFLAMAYILVVNPSTIANGSIPGNSAATLWNSIFIATALGAFIGTILMALLAKLPYAQAPGMGLNTQTWLVLMGFAGAGGYVFGGVMAIIIISGIIFLALTLIPCGHDAETGKMITVREKIFDGIPSAIRTAIPVGIGLFIAFIGFQNAGIVKAQDGIKVDLVNFTAMFTSKAEFLNGMALNEAALALSAITCLFGVLVIAILSHFKIKGSVLIGIVASTILGIPLGVTNLSSLTNAADWNIVTRFADFFSRDKTAGTFFMFDFANAFRSEAIMSTIMLIVTFCMIDMFDTIGTLVGVSTKPELMDNRGKPLNFNKAMCADAIATVAGACLGTSTVTTFVESGTGVAAGGRTGFASVITALMFLLAIFILPVFKIIPSAAAACGLIYVGVLMMTNVTRINFADIKVAVPAFLTIAGMPFFYSITDGIGFGLVSYVIISLICYVVDIIKYGATSKKATSATAEASGAENAEVSTAPTEDKQPITKPKFPISIVTGVITVLFLIMYLVPLSI